MRYSLILSSAAILFLGFVACKKSDKTNSAKTMANMSGTYTLTGLTTSIQGSASTNIYDSLPACEKDNKIVLDPNGGAQFIDAGTICSPSSDSTGAWRLSAGSDSLYLGDEAAFIQSFDGQKLVLTSSQKFSGLTVVATTTLTKN
jgi:hypothetical protein